MKVQQLIDILLQVSEGDRNKEVFIAESDNYTFSSISGIRSVDFTDDGRIYDTYSDTNLGEAIYLTVEE